MATPEMAATGLIPQAGVESRTWETIYPPEAWRRIRGEGIYLGCVLVFAVIVTYLVLKVDGVHHETALKLLCCGLGGIAGSWIYSVKWYVRSVTGGTWKHDYVTWRLTSPFMGIFLSVSAYIVIETGLIGITFVNKENHSDPKLYAYAIGFLVGLFSDDVMGKLNEITRILFGKSSAHQQTSGAKAGE